MESWGFIRGTMGDNLYSSYYCQRIQDFRFAAVKPTKRCVQLHHKGSSQEALYVSSQPIKKPTVLFLLNASLYTKNHLSQADIVLLDSAWLTKVH